MIKRRKKISMGIFAMVILVSTSVNAYKFDFVTVSDIVRKIKITYGELESYQADFVIISNKMGKKSIQKGVLKFKAPSKLLMDFHRPSMQKIISNGKIMWVYIPSMNVVAEQDLKYDDDILSPNSKEGLRRLFSKYHYRFASKEQPEVQSNKTKMYTLELKQKESRSGYRTIKLWVSEEFFIREAQGVTSSGKTVNIKLNNIKTNIDMPNGLFQFDIPARARVLKNHMISEE